MEHEAGYNGKTVLGFIRIDNYEEVLDEMPEEQRFDLANKAEQLLRSWTRELKGFLSKVDNDRYFLILDRDGLSRGEKDGFRILGQVRRLQYGNKTPLTLSLGLVEGEIPLSELGSLAQDALDLALDRGGDQVVVKTPVGTRFYGGTAKVVEKRTHIKARVIAQRLKEMVEQARNVIIVGHVSPDLDMLGAAFGLARALHHFKKPVYVVTDRTGEGEERLVNLVHEEWPELLLRPETGRGKFLRRRTLLIVVDTHRPSLLLDAEFLNLAEMVAVIDHHRRGKDFIDRAELVYLEPYASSASEMVTDLLPYLGAEIESLAATALLAGITSDTKHFSFLTGVDTFEAAAYLRREGADPLLVESFFRSDLEVVKQRAKILVQANILPGGFAVGIREENTLLRAAAQAADALLEVEGVKASFVVFKTNKDCGISARSHGDVNVQRLMEFFGGGGHLTMAGARLKDITAVEMAGQLKKVIQDYREGIIKNESDFETGCKETGK